MTHQPTSLSATAFVGQQIIYRGVRTNTEEPDLPDLLPDGTGTLLARK